MQSAIRLLAPHSWVLVILLSPSLADAAVVGFEGLGDHKPVGNQIAGASFQNATALVSAIGLNEFEHPARSGTAVAFDQGGPMTIELSSAQTSVAGYFTYLKPITLRAFNAQNTQVATASSNPACASNQALSGKAGCPSSERLSVSAAGIRKITITGDPAGTSFTLDDLDIPSLPGSCVSIVTPADGAVVTQSAVTLSWTPAPGTVRRYQLKVFNEATGVLELSLSIIGNLTDQVYTFRSGNYRIEMRSSDPACGAAAISRFKVQLPAVPQLAPTNVSCQVVNEANQNRLNCTWSQVVGADFFFINVVQPNTGPGGGALTVAGTQIGPNAIGLLVPNGNASVLVRGCNGDGCGPLSAPFPVSPNFGSPAVPVVAEPFNGSVVNSGSNAPGIVFTWNRVAGDTGSNYKYRLYVQDFSRNAAALDIITANNFHGAYVNPFTRYDVLVVAIPNSGAASAQGPASGFVVKGKIPNAPSLVSPTVFSTVPAGVVRIGWTPLPDSTGEYDNRLYDYSVEGTSFKGATRDLFVNHPLGPGSYRAIVRVCTTGITCVSGVDKDWGPFSGSGTAEGGAGLFTVQ